jgi:hypothetical protein
MATDIYRPARAGRPPSVLLHRTPYNKAETEATSGQCRFFTSRGYVVVNQDCRGCFGSEGDVNFLIPEAEGRRRHHRLDPQAGVVRRHGGHLRHGGGDRARAAAGGGGQYRVPRAGAAVAGGGAPHS